MLYQVKASYKYQAEDVDELNFEVGEVVDVVEYDDPEEQVCGNTIYGYYVAEIMFIKLFSICIHFCFFYL